MFFIELKLMAKSPPVAICIKREKDPKDPKEGYKPNQKLTNQQKGKRGKKSTRKKITNYPTTTGWQSEDWA
jgi:hypothetical protein